jgi:molybdenum cofactor guanylyltransferase
LEEYEAAVPEISGQLHPLFAAYRKDINVAVTQSLEENQLRIRHFLHNIHVKIVKKELLRSLELGNEELSFFNMNKPDEYHRALDLSKDTGSWDER